MHPFPRRLLFTATIFAGSFLLFLIQPMMARLALPRLGGAPAVWNSAMLVYQALLLGGYAYAHWLARRGGRFQVRAHIGGFALAALFLPIGLSGAPPSDAVSAFLWAPWLLLSSIGPLFLVVSANAPLLQRWFASAGGGDPYPLYAASNLGSFAGLIAYPLLLEPLLPLTDQRLAWTVGYAILFLLLIGCGAAMIRSGQSVEAPPTVHERLDRRAVGGWIWLAFIPSGLMLATTLLITTDLMAMPLLWVLPLGLYLLSFSVAFSSGGRLSALFDLIAPYALVPAAIALFAGDRFPLAVSTGVLLFALFAISVACHSRIYRSRPDPDQLTGFYLALAAGGALGGLFCALVAPLLFDWTYEYPLLLAAAALTLLPGYSPIVPGRWLQHARVSALVYSLSAFLVAAAIAVAVAGRSDAIVQYASLAALAIGTLAVVSRSLLLAVMAAIMILSGGWEKLQLSVAPGSMSRTYFGVYSVEEEDGAHHLFHGTTLHGVQLLTPGWERYATTYYGMESGVGRALQLVPAMFGQNAAVSVVGLGAGTLACYKQPGERWTFFELDPAVVEIASTSGKFSFLERCAPKARIVIGDARLTLAGEAPHLADVLVIDAFSSDAVPMHLLTGEAFDVYRRHLQPNGLLLVHISNRHLNLEPVVAAAPGWHGRFGRFHAEWDYRQETGSDWVALSPSAETIARLERGSGEGFWRRLTSKRRPWTDEHASLLPIFR